MRNDKEGQVNGLNTSEYTCNNNTKKNLESILTLSKKSVQEFYMEESFEIKGVYTIL